MTDPIDEYSIQSLKEYNDKKLMCLTKDNFEINETDEEKKCFEDVNTKYKDLIEFIKKTLEKEVKEVKLSKRLKESPCCLTTSEFGWTANMERIIKAQALRDSSMNEFMSPKKHLKLIMITN